MNAMIVKVIRIVLIKPPNIQWDVNDVEAVDIVQYFSDKKFQ